MTEVIRILLVEDDEDDYLLTSDYLSRCESPEFQLSWVTNSADAMETLQRKSFDLCLLDYMLGAEDAIDVLGMLKSNQITLPVVILTGQSDPRADEEVMRAGAADYLQKSEIDTPRFMRTIRYALVRREIENERIERHKIEQKNKAKDKFLAHLGHELRTPLTSILGYTELLLDEARDTEMAQELSIIQSNGKHLLSLLNDLLDMSRLMADKLELQKQPVSLNAFLTDVYSLMNLSARDKGLQLLIDSDGSVPVTINTDPTRLRQVLLNLISNAIKFTDKGQIHVTVEQIDNTADKTHSTLLFRVADTGIGMPRDKLESVFQPFEQIEDVMRTNHGGAGLGLAISRELVAMMGGDISVESRLGQGSTFSFTIDPGAIDDAETAPLTLTLPRHTEPETPCLHVSGRVLIVDDIQELRRLTGHLVSQCHARVAYAENGIKAVEAVLQAQEEKKPFHLVLMDIHMPVMDGIEALNALRKYKCNVAVIALTAANRKGLRQSLIEQGFDDILSKPIDRAELTRLLDRYLIQTEGPAPSAEQEKQRATETLAVSVQSRKVLVVEDDSDTADLIQLFLAHQGHDVIIASNGHDAISTMQDLVFEVVLMDLTLPDYHGYDLAREMKRLQPEVTIFIVSGYQPESDKMRSLGVAGSLLKPVSRQDLDNLFSSLPPP